MKTTVKKLGVLGGMGPLATSFFFDLVIKNTDAVRDQEHIDMVIFNHATIPDRTKAILANDYTRLLKMLIEDARTLESLGVNTIAIPCNTSHFLYDKIQEKVNIPVINMIEESVKYALQKYGPVRRIGILATEGVLHTKLYDNMCKKYGVEAVVPSDVHQRVIMDIIYNEIKRGEKGSLDSFMEVFNELKDKGCDVVLLACTELSYFKNFHTIPDSCIDTLEVLAFKSIEMSGAKIRAVYEKTS